MLTGVGGARTCNVNDISLSGTNISYSIRVLRSDYPYYLYSYFANVTVCDVGFFGGTGFDPPASGNVVPSQDRSGVDFSLVPANYPTTIGGTLSLETPIAAGETAYVHLLVLNRFGQPGQVFIELLDTSSAVTEIAYSTTGPAGTGRIIAYAGGDTNGYTGAYGAANLAEAEAGGDQLSIPASGSVDADFTLFVY